MIKPKDYDNVQEFTTSAPLPPGGYVCRIMAVEETTAKTSGAPMLKISLEIAEGEHKGFYANMYRSDTRQDKKWGCVVNQLVYDTSGATSRGFKTFNTAVEHSNSGFKIAWGDNYAACFKNKLIGGIFRREQFRADDGSLRFATKCYMFRSADEIRKGVKVPPDKLLDGSTSSSSSASSMPFGAPSNVPGGVDLSEYEEVMPDDNLPF